MKTLALDAMGVIYAAGDDVAELLCPFIREHGGLSDDSRIEALYRDASLGRISATQFWQQAQLDPALEDAYLDRHRLSTGIIEFLNAAEPGISSIWCISNDVSEWSRKLRNRFDLQRFFDGFVISGDVGARKPNPAIFRSLLEQAQADAPDILLVDDRLPNLDAAAVLGLQTILFAPTGSAAPTQHRVVQNFQDLLALI
jgi:putative hydrolase of the HAD superfamily